MDKDFDRWNARKKFIEKEISSPFYRETEIWWCRIGINLGSEQDGKGEDFRRPVLILRGFNQSTFFGVALIGRRKEGKYYFPLGIIGGKESSINLSQVRLMDSKRLQNRIAILDIQRFEQVKNILRDMLLP